MQSVAPAEIESDHAARGTACHEIAEICLRQQRDAIEFLDTVVQAKTKAITIDEELVASAQMYVEYVRKRMADYESDPANLTGGKALLWIEQVFSLADLNPPFEAGGTGDAVIFFPAWSLLEVVDLKNGMGVVDVKGNPQLRSYGLGALLKNQHLHDHIRQVRVVIVQPRVPHPDGRVRHEQFHVADLIDWTSDLLAAMRRTKEAISTFPGTSNAVSLDAWAVMWLRPSACKFCRAAAFCPSLRQKAEEIAGIWFDDQERPAISSKPDLMSAGELSKALDLVDLIEAWIGAVRGFAHSLAENGTEIPNYCLVDKKARRAWNGDDSVIAADLAKVTGRDADDFYEPKLRSPAQVEKLVGAKALAARISAAKANQVISGDLWSSKSSGTNLVRMDKTDRPAVASTVTRHFEPAEKES